LLSFAAYYCACYFTIRLLIVLCLYITAVETVRLVILKLDELPRSSCRNCEFFEHWTCLIETIWNGSCRTTSSGGYIWQNEGKTWSAIEMLVYCPLEMKMILIMKMKLYHWKNEQTDSIILKSELVIIWNWNLHVNFESKLKSI